MLSIFVQARTISAKSSTLSSLTAMMLMACFFCVAPNAAAQDPTTIRLVVLDGANQIAMPGQALPNRFAVRLTDDQGVPFVGATIGFANSSCLADPGPPMDWISCFGGADLGHFEPGADIPPWFLRTNQAGVALTDSNGVAVAPTYVAGPIPGSYSVWAYPRSVYPYYFSGIPSVEHMVYFQFNQSAPEPIPTLSPLALIALAAALGLAGSQFLRSRSKGNSFFPGK